MHAADFTSLSTRHDLDLRFETTTFDLNLEKQGLEDNTFTKGIGRDTTLIGDFVNATVHRRLALRLDADLGVSPTSRLVTTPKCQSSKGCR